VQSIGDIIQTIARQRGRGDTQPLLATLTVESAAGERIAHLPIDIELAQAWVALTAEPFRPHQAQALTALRRGEPVALRAASADSALTLQLLIYATLTAAPAAVALVLAPDESAAQAFWAQLAQINQQLPRAMQLSALLLGANRRPDRDARVIIATPEALHQRLLRHHDRAWQAFWARVQLVAIPDLQRYAGVAAAQLADLLMRLQRVAAGHNQGQVPNIVGTLHDLAEPEPTLAALLGMPWRVVGGDDGPRQPTMLAIWRGGNAWLRDASDLAAALQRQGYQAHIACRPFERALLAPIIGDLPRVTFGPDLLPGQVLVAAGYPGSHSAIGRMLRAGYQAVVLVLGEQPSEQALARHAPALLKEPATRWALPPVNAFVLAQNILCAASEQPLTLAEVEAWGVQDIVDHLVDQGQLVDLPDPEIAWKPTDAAGDPYAEWGLHSSSGAPLIARTEQAQPIGVIEAAVYERWAFPNAALPVGASGFRILARDDETGAITLRFDSSGRRTYPLRRCTVKVRDTRESRALAGGRPIGWGRVVVDEEIYGYREASSSAAPADMALKPALTTRWAAPACWFDLATPIQVQGQFVGWSLAAALPLRVLADFTDVVPCYDHEARRLYLVDAQPGGNGLSAWAYANAEELLPLAYDVALACRGDALLEPLSRLDMDWLLTLLGRQLVEEPPERQRAAVPRVTEAPAPRAEPPARPEPAPRPVDPPTPRPVEPPAPEPPAPRPVPPAPRQIEYIAGPPPAPPEPAPTPPPSERPIPLWDDLVEPPARPAPATRAEPPAARPEPPAPPERTPPPAEPAPRSARREPLREEPKPPAGRAPSARNGEPARPAARPEPPSRAQPRGSREPQPPAPRPEPAKPPAPPERTPPPAPPARADDEPPDAAALIERLRRQRQQREAQLGLAGQRGERKITPAPAPPAERRFAAGDRIFCLPYGDGVVQASRIEDGRELLTVAFPDHGALTIDPLVSLVRKIEDAPPEDDDLL
jgi:hypothetical protein